MPVTAERGGIVGKLFLNGAGELCRGKEYCPSPSATIENLETGQQTGGGLGSPILSEFESIEDCDEERLREVLQKAADTIHTLRDKLYAEKERNIATAEKFCNAAERYLNLVEHQQSPEYRSAQTAMWKAGYISLAEKLQEEHKDRAAPETRHILRATREALHIRREYRICPECEATLLEAGEHKKHCKHWVIENLAEDER